MYRKKILVIDDSVFFVKVIDSALTSAGYDVIAASSGEEGLRLVREAKPDLVLLDVVMPDINGFEVCRILRASESNNLMPIIMLTGQGEHEDMLVGLDLGADDYIIKPFDNRELLFRVKNMFKRIDRNRNANPLTGLPGNQEITQELSRRIEGGQPFAAVYADLDNFKAFNDVYGFSKGDTAIKLTADTLSEAAQYDSEAFLGHIGGDDFILITNPGFAEDISSDIIRRFDSRIRSLYSDTDLQQGFVVTYNRQGGVEHIPIMSISLAVVTNESAQFKTYYEVSEAAAELKAIAKSHPGSCYVTDMSQK